MYATFWNTLFVHFLEIQILWMMSICVIYFSALMMTCCCRSILCVQLIFFIVFFHVFIDFTWRSISLSNSYLQILSDCISEKREVYNISDTSSSKNMYLISFSNANQNKITFFIFHFAHCFCGSRFCTTFPRVIYYLKAISSWF